eukprot:TRINITY_DN5345_c0_g1_i2.p1 TRINITY_DN5345_c0_g1~~TRINITY_DN5345_c0_g1_i2.p1  ORF type:complete len:340 (-),score=31.85 TRINITY_DN5345_c0_g1_i2:52-1071(-)
MIRYSPNAITTIGFVFLVSNHIISMLYCNGETKNCEIPRPWFIFFAFNIFFYQLMDNLDGKQARKTASSSALGELFDHGCDSLYMMLTTYPVILTFGWNCWEAFYVLCAAITVFYGSHWEEYYTDKLILGVFANPTEGQVGCIVLFIFAYFFGPEWWQTSTLGSFSWILPSSLSSLSLRDAVLYTLPLLLLLPVCDNAREIYLWSRKKKRSFLFTWTKILPLFLHLALVLFWIHNSKIDIPGTQFLYLLHFHGFIFSYLCQQLVIARVTRQDFPAWNNVLFLPLFGALNTVLGVVPEIYVLPVLFWVLSALFLYYLVSVVLQLSHYLDIFVFKLGIPKH